MNYKITRSDSQWAKGFAILAVLLAHGNYFTGCGNYAIDRIIGAYCDCAMAIFLFMSGYGLYQSFKINGLDYYVRKKVVYILYPVVVTMFIQAVIKQCFGQSGFEQYSLIHLLLSIIGLKARNIIDATMWYIGYLWIWYILFWIISRFVHQKGLYTAVWIVFGVAGLYFFRLNLSMRVIAACRSR